MKVEEEGVTKRERRTFASDSTGANAHLVQIVNLITDAGFVECTVRGHSTFNCRKGEGRSGGHDRHDRKERRRDRDDHHRDNNPKRSDSKTSTAAH